jgi:two-component system response regulator GlrR
MTRAPTILVVDDDTDLLQLLSIRLQRTGFRVETADSAATALTTLERLQPDVVLTDLKMRDMDGLGLLTAIENRYPVLPVILLTAHGTIPDAVDATRKGAFAFLTKPINDDELITCLRDALATSGEQRESGHSAAGSPGWRSTIITRSPVMEALLQEAKLAAASDASIIIQSASGTGKEILARAIHNASM